jgi:hypothetical protein
MCIALRDTLIQRPVRLEYQYSTPFHRSLITALLAGESTFRDQKALREKNVKPSFTPALSVPLTSPDHRKIDLWRP